MTGLTRKQVEALRKLERQRTQVTRYKLATAIGLFLTLLAVAGMVFNLLNWDEYGKPVTVTLSVVCVMGGVVTFIFTFLMAWAFTEESDKLREVNYAYEDTLMEES